MKCQGCYILLCSPGRKMQNLLLITQLNVIGAVFNFKVIRKPVLAVIDFKIDSNIGQRNVEDIIFYFVPLGGKCRIYC